MLPSLCVVIVRVFCSTFLIVCVPFQFIFATEYGRRHRHDLREHFFEHFRETLLVSADQVAEGTPLLTDELITKLINRANFRMRATYLDTMLNLVHQARNKCLFLTTVRG
jgi:hypothetical protein